MHHDEIDEKYLFPGNFFGNLQHLRYLLSTKFYSPTDDLLRLYTRRKVEKDFKFMLQV